MLQEFEINELIGRFKRDADFDMGDDSMIAAVTMEELLSANKELTKQCDELLKALKVFTIDAVEHDLAYGDVVLTSCESLELAKTAVAKASK